MDDFGGLFDFNGDGVTDAAEFGLGLEIIDGGEESGDSDDDFDLELAGLDRDELEYMDEDERREAIEEAGLDPDDYNFD